MEMSSVIVASYNHTQPNYLNHSYNNHKSLMRHHILSNLSATTAVFVELSANKYLMLSIIDYSLFIVDMA